MKITIYQTLGNANDDNTRLTEDKSACISVCMCLSVYVCVSLEGGGVVVFIALDLTTSSYESNG